MRSEKTPFPPSYEQVWLVSAQWVLQRFTTVACAVSSLYDLNSVGEDALSRWERAWRIVRVVFL